MYQPPDFFELKAEPNDASRLNAERHYSSSLTRPRPKTGREDMNEILPRIFLGSYKAARNTAELNRHRITHIITLMSSQPNISFSGSHYFFPIEDNDIRIFWMFDDISSLIDDILQEDNNHKILIHCRAGISRSASALTAYFIYKGNSLKCSHDWIKSHRPCIHYCMLNECALTLYEEQIKPKNEVFLINL